MSITQKQGIDIFEKLLGDEDVVTFNNDSIEMKKYRNYERNFIQQEKDLKNLIIFYDDTVQFTTLGLIDMLLDHFDDIVDKDWDYAKFFYRGVENTYYINFVIKLFKEEFGKDLDKHFIKSFMKDNYSEILLRSPASNLIKTIVRCESIYSGIKIVFRCPFDTMNNFCSSLLVNHFTKNAKFKVTGDSHYNFDNEHKYLLAGDRDYDIIMIQNMYEVFKYLDVAKTKNLSIVGPNGHNGIPDKYFLSVFSVLHSVTRGPHASELVIYDEGIAVC